MPASCPYVFLDVDGVLIPFAAGATGRAPSPVAATDLDVGGNPLLDRLDPEDGRQLLALDCQLVWATTWMAEANDVVAPLLGLPGLPVVPWPDSDDEPPRGVRWKAAFLTSWAAGRTFVWLDDEITDLDRQWVTRNHPGKALLHRVDPQLGLTDADFSTIRQWLRATT
ncbi:HAD domain-containing protein [Solwaraspora sp. WMMA2065]|uniref:HAD domain-containing protein n=1 Tax=Solwaraspora sp. WMMA2065 TaxID=3015166 RepID=UPI00259BB405|nr:HAD domain-containing protein [Solwaraspora sp. WMMA2065]WJK32188.1 HAD domain-containing protein [Solwaraspora sp. WMMA2065]